MLEKVDTSEGAASRGSAVAVPAVTKAIAIIRMLNAASSTGLALADISTELGVTKSHCHNILKTLVAEGWSIFDGGRRRYTLAPRLLTDISRLMSRQGRSLLIHEELLQLSRAARVPCVLTRIDRDGSFIAIDKAEEAAELLVSVPIGHRFPVDAPAQMRARLAFSDAEAVRSALAVWRPIAHTATTIVDQGKLLAEIDATRARGYSISRSEFTLGVMSLAAPIFDAYGQVQLILQCPGVQQDIESRESEVAECLIGTAQRISELAFGGGAGSASS